MHDVHKLCIVSDPKIHVDLLRFCEHTRLAFLARSVPPDVMMRPVDVNLDPGPVIGVMAFFNKLVLFLLRFSYRTQLYWPFSNAAWETHSAL